LNQIDLHVFFIISLARTTLGFKPIVSISFSSSIAWSTYYADNQVYTDCYTKYTRAWKADDSATAHLAMYFRQENVGACHQFNFNTSPTWYDFAQAVIAALYVISFGGMLLCFMSSNNFNASLGRPASPQAVIAAEEASTPGTSPIRRI
jgi:hypothetical protein